MNDLVRFYREYYREQTPRAFDSLFAAMLDYDFVSYHDDMRRVFAMHQQAKCMGEVSVLRSGGSSTGERRKYEFGPNFLQVRMFVEGFLRMSHCKTLLVAVSRDLGRPVLRDDPRPPQCDFQMVGNWSERSHVDFMFEKVEKIFEEFGSINICALPCVWLSLTCNPYFSFLALKAKSKINALVNTDGSACFRRPPCRVRDQMMDWGSGVNFYSCSDGAFHFLPIFFAFGPTEATNLINLKRSSKSCDDLVSLGESAEVCSCGRPKIRMDFVPHRDNFPIDELGRFIDASGLFDRVPDHTEWLQIYQEESRKSHLFYSCSHGEFDLDDLLGHLEHIGFGKTEVVESKYFVLGNKKPIFWRSGNPSFFNRG